MPFRDSAPAGVPCWIDIMTSDIDRTRAFYGELLGWTSEEPNEELGGYTNFSLDGVRVAGAAPGDGSMGPSNVWSVYLGSDDIDATSAAVTANGGQVLVPPMHILDLGAMAVYLDAGGATIGAWQPGTHTGFGVVNEPNAPAYFECHTRDYAATTKFYADAFGSTVQTMSDTPEFRYANLVVAEEPVAGIMDAAGFLPEGLPSLWAVYFRVDDIEKALETTVRLGGEIVLPAEDTPYGKLAQCNDSTGTMFKFQQP